MSESKMIGNSAEFLRVVHAARMVAATDVNVLIQGEAGTGKEVLAREIHGLSQKRHGGFVVAKCAVIDDFSCLKDADQGTLFLDEVGQLKPALQGELLALLETGVYRGAALDVRVIASAGGDLLRQVEAGAFREDLYYRINIVPLKLPTLSERSCDISLLLKTFVKEFSRRHGRRAPAFSVGAKNLIKGYAWPGNIRELRNFAERMVILLPGQTVQPENLPMEMKQSAKGGFGGLFRLPESGIDLNILEADILGQALSLAGGNRSKAARLLNISRDTFLYRLQKFSIDS